MMLLCAKDANLVIMHRGCWDVKCTEGQFRIRIRPWRSRRDRG